MRIANLRVVDRKGLENAVNTNVDLLLVDIFHDKVEELSDGVIIGSVEFHKRESN